FLLPKPGLQSRCVTGAGLIVAHQVQRGRFHWQTGERVEQAMNTFARDPVAHAQQGRAAPASEVARRGSGYGDVAPGRHHPYARAWYTFSYELFRQRVAGHQQTACPAVSQPVEECLHSGPQGTVVDAPGWLV